MLADNNTLNLSFSGLKTAVRYRLVGTGKQDFASLALSDDLRADVAASFQQAAIDCVVGKARLAIRKTGFKRLCVGGGVAANSLLREQLQQMCDLQRVKLLLAPRELCTDNAVMGAIGWEKVDRGDFAPLDIDIQPGLLRK